MTLLGSLTVIFALVGADESSAAPSARDAARQKTLAALRASGLAPDEHAAEIELAWEAPSLADAVVQSLAACDESTRQQYESEAIAGDVPPEALPDPFLESHRSVWMADRLARAQLFDEAARYLERVESAELVEPASFHFLSAVCAIQLSQPAQAASALDELERLESLPARYQASARVLRSQLPPDDPESLVAIAHDMRDVRRRLDLGRTGDEVRERQESIIERLDSLIDQLEKQQQDQSSGQGSNSAGPSSPAPESRPSGGEGSGEVDAREAGAMREWGNLPAKEREKALQEIGRDLPGPYRNAVERYFRRLSKIGREVKP